MIMIRVKSWTWGYLQFTVQIKRGMKYGGEDMSYLIWIKIAT